MAEAGKGDPRWIVQNRDDGRNVNNWHWTEADYTSWTKNRITELIVGQKIETSSADFEVKSMTMTGEVSINTRKGKTIFFYELDVTFKYEGKMKGEGGKELKGNVHLPYISEENDYDDFEVKISVEEENNERFKAREELKNVFVPVLKQKIPQMLTELRETGMNKLAPKKADSPAEKPKTEEAPKLQATKILNVPVEPKTETKTRTCTLVLNEKFVCGAEDLYESFLDPRRVKAYAGGDAEINPTVGGKFKLFGGYVSGEIVELSKPNKMVQKWRMNTWPEGHFSTVTIEFTQKDNKVHLKLTQSNVPESDKSHTEGGWSSNFFARIKGTFGFGAAF